MFETSVVWCDTDLVGSVVTQSVLLSFDSESLPDKVMLGYMSYAVSAFVPNPLLCYLLWDWLDATSTTASEIVGRQIQATEIS